VPKTIKRINGELYIEGISLDSIAKEFSTPCYVYSGRAIEENYLKYIEALGNQPHLVCYAVKSNSNIAILQLLSSLGSGFDIVSIGELERVLLAGGDPKKVVFSGLAKSEEEMRRALEVGIHCFNIESESELVLLNKTAGTMSLTAPVSIRVNPDVDAKTHPYISTGLKEDKFGIDINGAIETYRKAAEMSNINIIGVDCHIGSQITAVEPFVDAMKRLINLVDNLSQLGIKISHIDIGGGLGVPYQNETVLPVRTYIESLLPLLKNRDEKILLEPGRSITANAGVLLTKVQYLKYSELKNFAVVDAAMNDMLRPSLYGAWMDIQPVSAKDGLVQNSYDVVGPVCESGDFLGKDRDLKIEEQDYLCLFSAGSYGFVMSSNYNSRPRSAEILVSGERAYLIRKRETFSDIVRGEKLLVNYDVHTN
jgi:diaminopimelate decarboxylase